MQFRLLALICVIAFGTAGAVEVTSLYTAQVPLDQEQQDPQAFAHKTALAQVLLKISGSAVVDDEALFEALFPNPSAWVVQLRPGPDDTLFVSFDGEALEETLKNAGQTVWGNDRPLTLVWLAVDWGQGEREIVGATDADRNPDEQRSINRNKLLRERVLSFAESRGLPVAFPLLDSEDLGNVTFSDIWGGFDERVLAASDRYDVTSVLIGRVRAASGQRPRWSWHFAGEQQNWAGEPEVIIMQVTDRLAAEFAIRGDEPLRRIDLHVSGINSVNAYGAVNDVLENLNVVEQFSVTGVEGDRLSFRVTAHGGTARLARALRVAGLVEEDRFDMPDFGSPQQAPAVQTDELHFFYSP